MIKTQIFPLFVTAAMGSLAEWQLFSFLAAFQTYPAQPEPDEGLAPKIAHKRHRFPANAGIQDDSSAI